MNRHTKLLKWILIPCALVFAFTGCPQTPITPAGISVPNVVGLTVANATTSIIGANLALGDVITDITSSLSADITINQTPKAGTSVEADTLVDLIIAPTGIENHLVTEGMLAPLFIAWNLNGSKVNLADYKGKIIVLQFWASWCAPSRASVKAMANLMTWYNDDVVYFAVNGGESVEDINDFMTSYNLEFPVLLDPSYKTEDLYGASTIPCIVVIAPDGIVKLVEVGYSDSSIRKVSTAINALLPSPPFKTK